MSGFTPAADSLWKKIARTKLAAAAAQVDFAVDLERDEEYLLRVSSPGNSGVALQVWFNDDNASTNYYYVGRYFGVASITVINDVAVNVLSLRTDALGVGRYADLEMRVMGKIGQTRRVLVHGGRNLGDLINNQSAVVANGWWQNSLDNMTKISIFAPANLPIGTLIELYRKRQ